MPKRRGRETMVPEKNWQLERELADALTQLREDVRTLHEGWRSEALSKNRSGRATGPIEEERRLRPVRDSGDERGHG